MEEVFISKNHSEVLEDVPAEQWAAHLTPPFQHRFRLLLLLLLQDFAVLVGVEHGCIEHQQYQMIVVAI